MTGTFKAAAFLAVALWASESWGQEMTETAVGIRPPAAERIPQSLEAHGHLRSDPYYWLRERENPAVRAYIEAENSYAEAALRPAQSLAEDIFREISARIPTVEVSPEIRRGDYVYYHRYDENAEHPVFLRRPAIGGQEQRYLDAQALSKGEDFFEILDPVVSPDGTHIVYALDVQGRGLYELYVKNLITGETSAYSIPNAAGDYAWGQDSRTIYYTRQDPELLRYDSVYAHRIGSDPAGDREVFREQDPNYYVFLPKSRSDRYIFITSFHTDSSEIRVIDTADPEAAPKIIKKRQPGLEYRAFAAGEDFYLLINDQGVNFRLVKTPAAAPGPENWEEIVPHRPDVLLMDAAVLGKSLALQERRDGLSRIRIVGPTGSYDLSFNDPSYALSIGEWPFEEIENRDPQSAVLRFGYSSFVMPRSIYEHDVKSRKTTLVHRETVGGGVDLKDYQMEFFEIRARDGVMVPVTVAYGKSYVKGGSSPLFLNGYGSYATQNDPQFWLPYLSLMDRGFAVAIAHVRGGLEKGRPWYDDGRMLNKMNSFTDFIDVGEALIARGYVAPDKLFARGGSGGGLLMGAVVNMRPDLWKAVILRVPFLDVMTTMLDPTVPLSTNEYNEWGNPHIRAHYDYMLAYSPYDNIRPAHYPHLYVTAGWQDGLVQYWEPAKWVARMRATKTDNNLLVMRTEMEAGHGGVRGRYAQYREIAMQWAFLLKLAED